MSHRQHVLAVVVELCAQLARPVTLAEIRSALGAVFAPAHLDAVCGSLVRTGHLNANRARQWVRETRKVYQPSGSDLTIDESATQPSRGEVIGRAVQAIWSDQHRGNTPISSKEIRAFLAQRGFLPELRHQPTLLPTVLNQLRRSNATSDPIVTAVTLPEVRAQAWVPFGADWVSAAANDNLRTQTDQVVAMVRKVLKTRQLRLVTVSDLQGSDIGFPAGPQGVVSLARALADATRPVQGNAGRRVPRQRPHLVNLGEVDGRAHYTLPEHLAQHDEGTLSPAHAVFQWCRLYEEWQLSRLEHELDALRASDGSGHLLGVRRVLVQSRVQEFQSRAAILSSKSPPTILEESPCVVCRSAIDAGVAEVASNVVPAGQIGSLGDGARWHTTRDAIALVRSDYGFGQMPSHVIQSFLKQEVLRRRSSEYFGRVGQHGQFQCRWDYEEVSLRSAGAIRWGSPEIILLVRQGMHLLGSLRNFDVVAAHVSSAEWSIPDIASVLGLLGDPRARPILERLLEEARSDAHREWVLLAMALLSPTLVSRTATTLGNAMA